MPPGMGLPPGLEGMEGLEQLMQGMGGGGPGGMFGSRPPPGSAQEGRQREEEEPEEDAEEVSQEGPLTMMRVISVVGLCLALGAGVSGCSKKGALSAEQEAQVKKYVSKTATKPQHPLDIKFDDKITLLGYDLSSDELAPRTSPSR